MRLPRQPTAAVALGLVVLLAAPAFAAIDPIRDAQWHLDFLDIAEAHRLSEGEGVVVAVVDSGVESTHPDLAGNVLAGVDVTSAGKLVGADPRGWADRSGHGTAMAGLIAAHGRSLGVAPRARVLPVRVRASDSQFAGTETPQGIEWAATHGAQVINVSIGGTPTPELRAAVDRAIANDIVVVAAVGNTTEDDEVQYPSAYPGALAVGGVDRTGTHAPISVVGPEVMIVAPAVEITSPFRGASYVVSDGTSNATAIVSGAAALVRARFPQLSAEEVIRQLTATADDRGMPGVDDEYGHGVLNIVRALTAIVPPPTPSPSPNAADQNGAARPTRWVLLSGVIVILLLVGGAAWTLNRRRIAA